MSNSDFAAADAALTVFAENNVDTVEESIRATVYGQELSLSLLLKEDELAPLFSGAAWAGTLLWDAAIHLTRRFLAKYRSELEQPDNRLRVIELGAGIGVPGMAARVAGAHHVVITEQDELLELMHRNLKDNASALRLGDSVAQDDGGAIYARPLSWGVDETSRYLQQHCGETYDVILSCDCIYEPLYGESWKALAQTMELLCQQNPRALVMMGVERRNADGIDKFLSFVATETQLTWTLDEETKGAKDNVLQVYFLRLPSTASS